MSPYWLMAAVWAALVLCAWWWRGRAAAGLVGAVTWLPQIVYFGIEVIVESATTQPYDMRFQPMSDLGVTQCGTLTHPLAEYAICSPLHMLMNWTMAVCGTLIAVGALLLRPRFPKGRQVTAAMWLLVVFGAGNTVPGAIPADHDFVWHVVASLPGMVVQIPALYLLGRALQSGRPKLAVWTHVCATIAALSLVLLFLQPVLDLPGGLVQRSLYGAVFIWCTVTAVVLLRDGVDREMSSPAAA